MDLSDKIRSARTRSGMSQCALAQKLGVAPSAVAQWETGNTTPTSHHLHQIAVFTGVDPRQLIGPGSGYDIEASEVNMLLAAYSKVDVARRQMVMRMLLAAGDPQVTAPVAIPRKTA